MHSLGVSQRRSRLLGGGSIFGLMLLNDHAANGQCAEVAGGWADEEQAEVGEGHLRAPGDADLQGRGSFALKGGRGSVVGDADVSGNHDVAAGCGRSSGRVGGAAGRVVDDVGGGEADVVGVGAAGDGVGRVDDSFVESVVGGLHVHVGGEFSDFAVEGGADVEFPLGAHDVGAAGDVGRCEVVNEAGEVGGRVKGELGAGGAERESDDYEDAKRKENSGGDAAIRNTRHGNSSLKGCGRACGIFEGGASGIERR